MIEPRDLTKRYGKQIVAVDRLTLRVRRGQVYGFFGPNGAGKTTILRLLLGLVRPSSGSAVVLGAPLLGIDGPPIIAEQRSQMGKERLLGIADLAERQGERFLAAARELKMQVGIVNAPWPQAEPG